MQLSHHICEHIDRQKRMRIIAFLFSIFSFPAIHFCQVLPDIVINEINCDNPGGPDNAEFIELYGIAGTSLDSLSIVLFEGTDNLSYAVYDLDGYVLDESGFFVLGSQMVTNVDYIIANGIISNGPDGIALFYADASDFPIGTLPSTVNRVDAAVYGTNDSSDTDLITALGLDMFSYLQLDETIQTTTPDFSLSKIPDGGDPFMYTEFVLQEVTPGSQNAPICQSGTLLYSDLSTEITLCSDGEILLATFEETNNTAGEFSAYVLTTANGIIIDTTNISSFDFNGYTEGTYQIYSLHFNGEIIDNSLAPGNNILDVSAGLCVDVSDNFLSLELLPCDLCNGGEISSSFGYDVAFCSGIIQDPELSNSTGESDYLYFVTTTEQLIVGAVNEQFDYNSLAAGIYRIYGLSYSGNLLSETIEAGQSLLSVSSDVCTELSSNYITLNILPCQPNTPCEKIFISEYLEGEAGTRALELFNPALTEVDISEYSLWLFTNGSTEASDTLFLPGTLAPLSTLVIANPGTGFGNGLADPELVESADIVDFISNFTGNDAIELHWLNEVIDVIGVRGENPGNQTGWSTLNGSTSNFDLVRKPFVQSPVLEWQVSSFQWDAYPNTDYSTLGSHFFHPCSDELIAGFLLESIMVEESDDTLELQIQCLNAIEPTTLNISIETGSSEPEDYAAAIPVSLVFDPNNLIQTIEISIMDDLIPETLEYFTLTLSTDAEPLWTNQSVLIQIKQSDANCDGGILVINESATISQCADLENNPLLIQIESEYPSAHYMFIISDTNNVIVDTTSVNTVDPEQLGEGTFRIYGLSYSGELDYTGLEPGNIIQEITADSCVSLSENFITVIRNNCLVTGCDAGQISTSDGSVFITACVAGTNPFLNLNNTGQSTNDSYVYFLTDNTGMIVDAISGNWNTEGTEIGSYQIYGVSYNGTLDPATMQTGMPLSGITSDSCVSVSENSIALQILDCQGPTPCSQLFFSEYIEETGSNKALEVYNPTPLAIDLSNYSIRMYADGSLSPSEILQCNGIILPYDVFVVVSSGNGIDPTDPIILAQGDTLHPSASFSANDAIELVHANEVIDVIGIVGENPGQFGWTFGNASTSNQVLVRRPEVTAPNIDWDVVSGQWIAYDFQDFSHIGWHEAADCGFSGLPVVSFIQTNLDVYENAGTVAIEIFTSNAGDPFEITIQATGSAEQILDYSTSFPVTLDVPTGENTLILEIFIVEDAMPEGIEFIELSVTTGEEVYFGNQTCMVNIEEFTGTNEQDKPLLKIWPIPASQHLYLLCNEQIVSCEIVDQLGKKTKVLQESPVQQIQIDVSNLTNGVYILNISTNEVQIRQKAIVAK